jgi:hypothetical protein
MAKPFDRLDQYADLVISGQAVISLALSGFVLLLAGPSAALAVLSGGLAAGFGAVINKRRARRAGDLAEHSPAASLTAIYVGLVQKILIIFVVVFVAWRYFGLDPFFLFVGLAAAQLAYIVPIIRA